MLLMCASHMSTALVVVTVIPLHHFIHLSVLFLSRWCEYSGLTRNCFSFLSFHSLSSSNCMLTMQKIILALQFICSCDSIPPLICNCFIYIDYFLFDFIFNFIPGHLIFLDLFSI